MSFQTVVQYALAFGGISITAILTLIYFYQSRLIYLPQLPAGSRETVWAPSQFQMEFEEVWIETEDGISLHAYWIPKKKKEKKEEEKEKKEEENFTILYCHANAGNMGHRLPIAQVLHSTVESNILMFSYRGYGKSKGTPNEAGMKKDANAVFKYLLERKSKVVPYGQSIGGAVAIYLYSAFADQISGIIVENTFTSIPELIPSVLPIFKHVAFLCTEKWESYQALCRISKEKPVLFLSGKKDELVPHSHMLKLYSALPSSASKQLKIFDNGTHNDTCLQDGYFESISHWWKEHIQK